MARWHHEAVVVLKPHDRFPVDMLRYDECYPKTSEDASEIVASIEAGVIANNFEGGHVKLVKHTDSKRHPWTDARWRSFGISSFQATESRKE